MHDLHASPHDAVHRVELGAPMHQVAFVQPRAVVVACGAGTKLVHLPAWLLGCEDDG